MMRMTSEIYIAKRIWEGRQAGNVEGEIKGFIDQGNKSLFTCITQRQQLPFRIYMWEI